MTDGDGRYVPPMPRVIVAALLFALWATATRAAELPTADEVEAAWVRHDLDWWFPRCVDPRGGFFERFDANGEGDPLAPKTGVFQARMTWVAATAARRRPELRGRLEPIALHGLEFLRDALRDPDGGVYWQIDADGRPLHGGQKHLYNVAFAVYAAAAVERAMPGRGGGDLAMELFGWLDRAGHDPEHGGYLEHYGVLPGHEPVMPPPFGYKSLNAHLHLLEALAELHRARPDPRVAARLRELIDLHLGPMYVEPGVLHAQFTADWRPLPDLTSYGHNVEAAHLIADAIDALGDAETPAESARLAALVDAALAAGWLADAGTIADTGTAFAAVDLDAEWWAHAEAFNALLRFADRARAVGDAPAAARLDAAAADVWQFIDRELLDHARGGWRRSAGDAGEAGKSGPWKAAYHTTRSLLDAADILRDRDAADAGQPRRVAR